MGKQFDFWQDHSEIYLTMAYLYDRQTTLQNPDGFGRKTGDCGDTITLYLRIREDIINEVTFELSGCLNTNACCNALAVLVEGKKANQCWDITPNTLIHYLETLPLDHHHCAELTIGTFYLALADYNDKNVKKNNDQDREKLS